MRVKERRGYRRLWRRDIGANGGNDGASCFMEMMDMREPTGGPIGEASDGGMEPAALSIDVTVPYNTQWRRLWSQPCSQW